MSNRKKIKKVRELAHRAVHVAKLNRVKAGERALRVTPFEMQVLQSMEDGHWEQAVDKELNRQGITLAELADHLDIKVEVRGAPDPVQVP